MISVQAMISVHDFGQRFRSKFSFHDFGPRIKMDGTNNRMPFFKSTRMGGGGEGGGLEAVEVGNS